MYANKTLVRLINRAILFVFILCGNSWAGSEPCVGGKVSNGASKVTVLFVNGIFNTLSDACNSSAKLIASMPAEARANNYSYIWNPDSWLDPIELIDQERISGEAVVSARLQNNGIFDKTTYYKILGEKYQLLIQSPTEKRTVVSFTRALHFEIERLLHNGQSIVVVPHSQGNHMIEAAYAMFVFYASLDPSLSWKLDKIRVVGFASVAHTTPSGKYVTISEDGALASFEAAILFAGLPEGRPLERNYAICTSFFDFSCRESVKLADFPTGHGFAEIYLNDNLKDTALNESMRTIFANLTTAAIRELNQSSGSYLNPSNNHSYELITCGTWSKCRDAALAKGGSLVTVRNQAENDWLQSTFGISEDLWIGMYYDGYAKELKWVSGEPITYSRWGENKNGASVGVYPEEYCVYMNAESVSVRGYWNDVDCGNSHRTKAIIEYLPNGYQGKTSWDLAGDFTTRTNPTGVWRFGYRMNSLSAVQSLVAPKSNCSDLGLTCWLMSATAPDIPFVGANLNDGTLTKRTIGVAPNEVVLHPGLNGEQAVVAWKAPAVGTYRIKGTFQVVDVIPTGVNVAIDEGLASIYSASLGRANQSGNFDFSRNFAKDEVLYFSVDAAGNYGNDSTALSLTITKTAGNGSITILAYTIPGATLIVPVGASNCSFTSTGTWSAGPNAPPQYQNADGVIGGTSYNLTNFGVPMPGEGNMALVVKQSSTGQYVLLGSSKTISVSSGETLTFMMNDATSFGYTDGNTGQLSTVWSCN